MSRNMKETHKERSRRILAQLEERYPGTVAYDLDGRSEHFLSEVEPVADHPEYDRAVEVIISSKPHKHLKMIQYYTVISGNLELHVDNKVVTLKPGDKYSIPKNAVHWAKSDDECWVEIYSEPGWTKEDHIAVNDK